MKHADLNQIAKRWLLRPQFQATADRREFQANKAAYAAFFKLLLYA